jgi:hypothetical protein
VEPLWKKEKRSGGDPTVFHGEGEMDERKMLKGTLLNMQTVCQQGVVVINAG